MHLEENQGGENAEEMGEKSPAVLGAGGTGSNNGNPSLSTGETDSVQDTGSGASALDLESRQEEGEGHSTTGGGESSLEGHEPSDGDGKGEGLGGSLQDTSDVGTSIGEPSLLGMHSSGGRAGGNSDSQARNISNSSSSSGPGTLGGSGVAGGGPLYLPWGARKDRGAAGPGAGLLGPTDMDARPGEFVMRTLFAEFTVQAERKIEAVMAEPPERPISKSLQRGEDPQFDQLLCAFGSVAEHCLPSLLRALFAWYDRQIGTPLEFQQFRSHQHHHRTPASALLSSLPISTSSAACGGSGMASASSLGSPIPGATGTGSNSGTASGTSSSSTPVASSSPGPHHQQETGVLKKGGRIPGSSVIGGLSVTLGESSMGDKGLGSGVSGVGGVSALVGVVGSVSDKSLGDKGDSGGSGGSSSSTGTNLASGGSTGGATAHGGVEDEQRRTLAVEFLFCLALIEVLKQLPFHPGQDDLVAHIENLSFAHFKYREGLQSGPNAGNIHMIADLYAEVIGGLAQSRFNSVRKRFMTELGELRAREPGPHTTQSIISLLMGMKFFRVKMAPIEEFEASFQFMQECAQYFLEVKDKDIKHALAGLFVEILVPVAAAVKNEVNVPCLKNFVEMLYVTTLDMCTKSKHRLALFPLVTCLLCVSQKASFLQNWHVFLAVCLSHLKNRDPKMSRVALESLYRLLWVYMIRIKCESNSATQSRLHSIVHSLFPKGSKAVVPRETPLNIFVKIIQFIAQERLDFAMREIVLDLLCVGRPVKVIMAPERMSVGLRAFLVVADSLQQKEGEPPMPRSLGVLPSGNTLRIKKTFLSKMLTEETARSIGMSPYFPYVRRIFDDILRALDLQYGRPLMMTNTQNVNKEPDEMMSGERKPRIDLFRTCVAAVPRLIPDGMSSPDLVDLLSRLTTHLDAELASLAFHSLQTLVMDFPDWRHHVICGFIQFLVRDVLDTFPQLLDNGIRMLLQLLVCWKNALIGATVSASQQHNSGPRGMQRDVSKQARLDQVPAKPETPAVGCGVFHFVEGFALVMLCQCRPTPRRLVVPILREVKALLKITGCSLDEEAVIDAIDRCCPKLVESILSLLPPAEKTAALSAPCVDLQWLTERSSSVWTAGIQEEGQPKVAGSGTTGSQMDVNSDPWFACLMGFLVSRGVGVSPTGVGGLIWQCSSAVNYSWPIAFSRLHSLFNVIDPSPVSDNRASLLRSSAAVKKPASERDVHMIAWRYLAAFAFRVVPPQPSAAATAAAMRSASPDLSLSSSPDSLTSDRGDSKSPAVASSSVDRSSSVAAATINVVTGFGFGVATSSAPGFTPSSIMGATSPPSSLYKLVIPLLRYEATDVRDAAVNAIGRVNPEALKDVMEELVPCIREVVDRKQENMRRRRRRDALRLQLVRVLELIAENATFGLSPCVLDRDTHSLHPTFVEYVEGARLFLEAEEVKEGGGGGGGGGGSGGGGGGGGGGGMMGGGGGGTGGTGGGGMSGGGGGSGGGTSGSSVAGMVGGAAAAVSATFSTSSSASLSSYSSSSSSLLRLHFCNFVRKMIRSFPLERRHTLLKRDLRRNLFTLFSAWSGRYGCAMSGSAAGGYSAGMSMSLYGYGFGPSSSSATGSEGSSHLLSSSTVSSSGVGASGSGGIGSGSHGTSSSHGSASESCTELQLSALQAMSALLCCGPCFDPKGLAEEGGYFYPWLDLLLHSRDEKVYGVGCETVVLLLECNPDIGALLDWAVDRCYTAPPRVADACFLALATTFSLREYPCDHYTGIINVTLLSTGCPRAPVHETALQLLQLLDQRFFGDLTPPIPSASSCGSGTTSSTAGTSTITLSDTAQAPGPGTSLTIPGTEVELDGEKCRSTLDVLLSTTYCRSQMYLSRQLSHLHPELTMPMFSEITHRFQTARPEVRQLLLQYLLPWLHNMELVDPHVPPANPLAYLQHCGGSGSSRREGWGSAEATEMVLNNLFYITAKFGDEHPKEIEEVWATLCTAWPNNLKVIIRYLLIVSGMAPHQLLPYAKRVVVSLAHARPDRLLEELLGELQAVETLSWLIERTQTPPFYRLTSLARKASSSQSEHGGNIASATAQSSANAHHGSLHPSSGVATLGGGASSGRGGASAHSTATTSASGGSGGDKASAGVTIRSHGPEEKGMIHTKRHSAEEHSKSGASKSDSALRALAGLAGPLLFSSGSIAAASSGASGVPTLSSPSTSTTTLSSTPSSLSTPSSAPPPPPPPPMSPANTKCRTASGPAAIVIDEASAGRPISPMDPELTPTEEGNMQFPSQQPSMHQAAQSDSKQLGASGQATVGSSGQAQGSVSGQQGGMDLPPPPQPHPLPMPEYGGFFAPLTEYLPDASQPISGFHRCNVAVMLLSDVVVEGLPGIDWTPHLPLILHILFLGMDHARPLVHSHCRRLLLRLLIVLSSHGDHLTVARVLLLSSTALPSSSPFPTATASSGQQPSSSSPPPSPMTCVSPYTSSSIFSSMPQAHFASALSSHTHPLTAPHTTSLFGSSATATSTTHYHRHAMPPAPPPLLVVSHNFTEPEPLFDSYMHGPITSDSVSHQNEENGVTVSPSHPPPVIVTSEDGGRNVGRERIGDGNQMQQSNLPKPGPNMPISDVIKSMIAFLASREHQPLWNYEDITAKVWNVHSAEQLDCFLQHVLRIFSASLALPPSGQPMQTLAYQWANTALHLGLSCSSRHYAGRSLQVFRALRVPINLRMLTDILSRLVETVAEQAEDMQGYVTELLLTLEASVECLGEWDPRPLDHARDLFKSTPNLNNSCSTTTTSPCSSPCPSPSCSSASSSTSTLASTVQNNCGSTGCRRAGHGTSSSSALNAQLGHTRSTSFSVPYASKRGGSHAADSKDPPNAGQNQNPAPPAPSSGAASSIGGSIKASSAGNLSRSRSAQSLKGSSINAGMPEAEDSPTILTTLFWLSVCLLESDFEHEFLLALRLLGRLLDRLPLEHPECRERMERVRLQLRWPPVPGNNGGPGSPNVVDGSAAAASTSSTSSRGSFPGVHALVLKGCTHPGTYEATVALLSQCTLLLDHPVIDPTVASAPPSAPPPPSSQASTSASGIPASSSSTSSMSSTAFPMNVVALLPYLLLHFEDADNALCIRSAENIAQVSVEKSKKLENLGTVMTLYSRRTFSKESFQWTKCVVKYLYDSYSHLSLHMLAFLVEVLEKGPCNVQVPILSIIHCMLHYVDLASTAAQPINADLLRVIAKYIDGVHWKEALKILKLVVTRSSTLVAPPASLHHHHHHYSSSASLLLHHQHHHWGDPPTSMTSSAMAASTISSAYSSSHATYSSSSSSAAATLSSATAASFLSSVNTGLGSSAGPGATSFGETEIFSKKELPGRTMDFTFDLSQTPVIGRRYLHRGGEQGEKGAQSSVPLNLPHQPTSCSSSSSTSSPRRSASLTQADSSGGWKRPWLCQSRVRECLVSLLNTCGQRVGLPKSPSVIFSQSSDLLERQSSMASSSEEVSATPTNDMAAEGSPNVPGGIGASVGGVVGAVGAGSIVPVPATSQGGSAQAMGGGSISVSSSTSSSSGSSSTTVSSTGSSTVVNPSNAPPSTTSASPSPSAGAIAGSGPLVGANVGGGGGGGSSGSASASTSSVNAGGTEQFGVFRDFDFLEYESESLEGESTDNFNWGVRRRPLSDGGESEFDPVAPSGMRAMSLEGPMELGRTLARMTGLGAREEEVARLLGAEAIPLMAKRSRLAAEDSSDEEVGSESPLDETATSSLGQTPAVCSPTSASTPLHHCTCSASSGGRGGGSTPEAVSQGANSLFVSPMSIGLREWRRRRNRNDSGPRSDTSGSSIGDPSEVMGGKASSSLVPERESSSGGGRILPDEERDVGGSASSVSAAGVGGVGSEGGGERMMGDVEEGRSISAAAGGVLSPEPGVERRGGGEMYGVDEGVDEDDDEEEEERDVWWRRRVQAILEDLPLANYPPRSRLALHRSLLAPFTLLRGILKDSCERGEALAREGKRRLGCGIGVSDDLATMSSSLSSAINAVAALSRDPPSAWFGIPSSATGAEFAAALGDGLRFALLEVQEHLDTFSDRKVQAVQGLRAAKAVCRSHRSLDATSVADGEASEAWRVELGKVLYKLLFQLLLLVEASWKSIATLISTAGRFQLQDMSGELAVVKARLGKAGEEMEEGGEEEDYEEEEDDFEEEESESVSMGDEEVEPMEPPEEDEEEARALARLIRGGKWRLALVHVHRHRDIWSDECFAEDDVSLALNVYALRLVREKRDAFVVSCPEREVPELATQLKESLLLVLGSIKGLEGRVGKRGALGPLGREGGVLRRRLPRGGRGLERRGRVGEVGGGTGGAGGVLLRRRGGAQAPMAGSGGARMRTGAEGTQPANEMEYEEEEGEGEEGDEDDEEEDETDMAANLTEKSEG